MKESIEKTAGCFKLPDIRNEKGEFGRVAETFNIDLAALIQLAEDGELVSLDPMIWEHLDNTDSNKFSEGDWDDVHDHSNPNGKFKRDWKTLKETMEAGTVLDAPIIMKYGELYHLVSGNTRLMISKAKGITPKVFIFEVPVSLKESIAK